MSKCRRWRQEKHGDLSKHSIPRDMLIERGAMNHSCPVLALNLRFLKNDHRALLRHVHDPGYWVLLERHRPPKRALLEELQQAFPKLDNEKREGDSEVRSSYFHIAVRGGVANHGRISRYGARAK